MRKILNEQKILKMKMWPVYNVILFVEVPENSFQYDVIKDLFVQ